MKLLAFSFVLLLSGCVSVWHAPDDFVMRDISAPDFTIRTYQKITSATAPIHIYIEGDGNAFNSYGIPTSNPTPRGHFMRDLAASDLSENVVYIARPCQYIMSPTCDTSDWTDGRFSARIIDNMAHVVRSVADNRQIVLIGYSGGAMVSGLIISQNPDMKIKHWATIAGVLNHSEWTEYFNDVPLTKSQNLEKLPNVPQSHYVASRDMVVPMELSERWTRGVGGVVVMSGTRHNSPI